MEVIERVVAILEEVRREFAPDPRVSVFEVGYQEDGSSLVLIGAISEPAAAEALHRRIALLEVAQRVEDRVVRLPLEEPGLLSHALVTASAAPMLAGPVVSESHVSQSLLGHRLLVLREQGRWLHCRSDDGYLGWVHRGYVHRVDEPTARAWAIGAGGEACLSLGATLMGEGDDVVARLPWGARVVRRADGTGALPDGRVGRLVGELVPRTELPRRFPAVGEAVVETAERWLGAPYLWGGTTPAGVDCSGLAQAVYRTHGVELPRDSDQQAQAGTEVEPGADFANLRPGDLLFFAEEPGRITHVTLSMGAGRIIHSSLGNGGVRRNDLNGGLHFEQELARLFVCARRILPPEE